MIFHNIFYTPPEWSVAIFCQYKLLGLKKISFLAETSAYISESKLIDRSIASVNKFNESSTTKGISIAPLVTYDLSERFSIIATGVFLRLDISTKTTKYRDSILSAEKRNHFGFTGQSKLFGNYNFVRIGFIYHFSKSSP